MSIASWNQRTGNSREPNSSSSVEPRLLDKCITHLEPEAIAR